MQKDFISEYLDSSSEVSVSGPRETPCRVEKDSGRNIAIRKTVMITGRTTGLKEVILPYIQKQCFIYKLFTFYLVQDVLSSKVGLGCGCLREA
jgi:hypothetical protein